MGSEKVTILTQADQRKEFMTHLLNDMTALEYMLKEGLFETGITRIGAEQELCIIDNQYKPHGIVMELLPKINDDHFTTEYLKFNMEINLDPLELTGACFSTLEKDLLEKLRKGEKAAIELGGHIIQVGILPTIHREDVISDNLTPLKRYKALTDKLKELRGSDFSYRIEGKDQWITTDESTLFEGCCTSFQVHYQVDVNQFADKYNRAQLLTGPIMASAGNSALFLRKRLWHETRIALFQQSVDIRKSAESYRYNSPRVGLGNTWIQEGPMEYFQNEIIRHKPILVTNQKEDALELLKQGVMPKLRALNVHNGTVYRWNRTCYGLTDGKPHLRIENRILPSGPSSIDEVANAAFWIGLMHSDDPIFDDISNRIKFDDARENFYNAAKMGLDVSFSWFDGKKIPASLLLLNELLPISESGLKKAGVVDSDIQKYLSVIEQRVASGKTGSAWMINSFDSMAEQGKKEEILVAITSSMSYLQRKNIPVHEWDLATLDRSKAWEKRYYNVHQIMNTDLFTIHEDDILNLATKFMDWKYIRHIPVENEKKELVGIVTSRNLLSIYASSKDHSQISVKDIMEKDLITVTPQDTTIEAVQLMRDHNIGCLPVVQDKRLVGIITERDVLVLTDYVLNNPQ